MNTKNTKTKKASAPETRYTAEQIEKQISEHKYIPRAAMGDSPAHCPDCEGTHCPGIGAATDSGKAPREADFNASALLSGANPSEGKIIDELALSNLQKEQNWSAYQEALRLLDKAEDQRDELLAACKNLVRQIERDNLSGRYNVGAVNAAIANAEGRAQ